MDVKQNEYNPFMSFEGMVYATSLSLSAFVGSFVGIFAAFVIIPGPALDATLNTAIVPYSLGMPWIITSVMRNRGEMRWKECLWAALTAVFYAIIWHVPWRFLLS
jgi:hypothetical protein